MARERSEARLRERLRDVPLFEGLGGHELAALARELRPRNYPEGAQIVAEGEGGTAFFVILDGVASVGVGGKLRRGLGPGDVFGELALIDGGRRSASVVAATDLRCVALSRWAFRALVRTKPSIAWRLLRTLARRLREAEAAA